MWRQKRESLSTYRILTAPLGEVMEGQLKRLAANKVQGSGSVCVMCMFPCVCMHLSEVIFFVLINYHQYTCLCLRLRVKPSPLCLPAWVYVYYCDVFPRPPVSSKALLKRFRWSCETVSLTPQGYLSCFLTHDSSPITGSPPSGHHRGY